MTPITNFILDLLKLVLHNMNFTFKGDHYLQTGGTAMGTSLAPNYANLFMDRLEIKALAGYPQKPLTWKRFIDDIFLVRTHGEESLKKFFDYLNSLHDTIKFTHEMSYTNIDFLDTTVKVGHDRGLITTLFNKPTDTHLYLEYSSAHPQSVLTKGPFGQYLRLRRICTLDCDFEANAKKLSGYYLKRGYPFNSLKKHYLRARKFSQDELLDTLSKTTNEAPVMVTQFNPRNTQIGTLVQKNWNIIQNTEELSQIFSSKPLMGFRRLPNLRDILTSSTISYPPNPTTDAKQSVHIPVCTRLGKCTYCPKIKKAEQFTSFYSKQVFKCKSLPPKHKVTCELINVIYIINCNKCGLQYIGETKRPFRNRIYKHLNSVQTFQHEKSTPVSRHFTQNNHSVKNMDFSFPMDGRSNKPKCHLKAQKTRIILYLGIPYTLPCRHQYVCMKICPLMAPITQVPPLSFMSKIDSSLQM